MAFFFNSSRSPKAFNRPKSLFPKALWAFILLTNLFSFSQEKPQTIKVSYVTAELVYLDSGKNVGLLVGDLLEVLRNSVKIASLEVTHISENSAACKIRSQTQAPAKGDIAVLQQTSRPARPSEPAVEVTEEAEADSPLPQEQPIARERSASKDLLSGTIGLQWFQFQDQSDRGADYQQPALRLNIKGKELFGKHLGFTIRTRTRRVDSNSQDESNFQNRVYQAAVHYQNPDARLNYSVGRIISSTFSGAGYIDGALLDIKLGKNWTTGAFGGYQPEWKSSDLSTETLKYGAYVHAKYGDFGNGQWASTLGWSSAYHDSEIDREFLFVQNRFTKGSKFQFYQNAELELNRGWRKERTGKSMELSNLYAFARYQFTPGFRLGFSYDDRQNYYTYELQNQDQQFFDDLARKGLKADFQAKFTKRFHVSGFLGQRQRDNDLDESNFYNLHAYWRPGFLANFSFDLTANAFDNPNSEGDNTELRIGRFFGKGRYSLHVSFADYQYDYLFDGSSRESQWLRLESYALWSARWYTHMQLEQSEGDDLDGLRILFLLGYRL